ncbi:uncharacterized protein KY384_006020 [Bacidia gigantensis]|uniref:uncharacterized protein n=1 Tax=Bacidia gigantensis TaxID=2732470 RepID=UPI001D03F7EA|nr:uncharacterized protein KY384_006020 [Bacidia gigantensis]KAG8529384.1 hypothetical protein KY384_006020 [Bacidia gigantensis]
MRAIWHPDMQKKGEAKCFSPHITYLAGYIGFGLDAFTDLACSAIPIFIIKPLHMRPRTKWPLCVLMGLGCLTAAYAIAKAVTLEGVFDQDYTFGLTKPAVCTILEHLFGMILASLPALRTMFGNLFGKESARGNSDRRSGGRDTPPWWTRQSSGWSTPKFTARTSWVPPKSWRLGRKEKESFSGTDSEGSATVVESPQVRSVPQKHRKGEECVECGGTGVMPPKSIKKTVS